MRRATQRLSIILMVGPFLVPVGSLRADPIAENQARFGKVEGSVFLLTQGAKGWINAHEGLPIEPGDHVHAEEGSTAEIALSQHVLVWLQPDADILTDTTGANGGRLHVLEGSILARIDSAHARAPQHWELETPAAVISVRGTELAIDVHPQEGTKVGLFEGMVGLQPAEGPSGLPPSVAVKAGEEALLGRGKAVAVHPKFSEVIASLQGKRADLVQRQRRITGTWSPFTVTVQQGLRRKFVAQVAVKPLRARPARKRPFKTERRPH